MKSSNKVVYSKTNEQKKCDEDNAMQLPDKEQSQVEYLKTKLKMVQAQLKNSEVELKSLRQENDKLRVLNSDYVKQLNSMSLDKFKKIDKIVIQQAYLNENIDEKLKELVKKQQKNFGSLEKEHAKLIDHCRIMENDLNYYKVRVNEAEEINENLRSTGRSNINEVMEELRELRNQVDQLTNDNTRAQFDLAVKLDECERLQQDLEQAYEIQTQLENAINDLKIKHNRILSEHEEKFNKDAKFIYQLKLKSDFLDYERRLAYQDASNSNQEKTVALIKTQQIENELNVLKTTTENFLKTNTMKNTNTNLNPKQTITSTNSRGMRNSVK